MAKIMQNMFRTTQNIFDFKGIPASNERYGIHQYPAMLHYMLVRSLLKKYDGVVYDPFCGSGVVITEAIKQNRKVYGTDINPLALLIAKVRSSNYDVDQLQNTFQQLKDNYNNLRPEIPAVKNLEYWFKPQVINDLGKIRTFITQITDDKIREFFLVVFSETVRKVSNNKSGEFKRFRLNDEKLKVYKPDALNTFVQLFKEYVEIVQKYKIPDGQFYLYLHDTRKPMPFDEKIDLVITSPPYGDSRTTVAYGQFSSFSLDWIKGLNPFGDADLSLDKESLGGKKVDYISLPSKKLNTVLEKIQSKTPVRLKKFIVSFMICI
ncbi:DNA methyltransferase [Petrotoga sp. HWH.PT.55.6.1]|uniref:DNA methyltransferase n=1 Tax=Petrotoga sp. HWH.PT.55.6.1 TaxID=1307425 RepID=UPI000F4D8FA2|nr:DNA methyltransferase [Petrotoga sp. HWH.PT.55.6.1]